MSNLICHPQAQPNLLRFFSKDESCRWRSCGPQTHDISGSCNTGVDVSGSGFTFLALYRKERWFLYCFLIYMALCKTLQILRIFEHFGKALNGYSLHSHKAIDIQALLKHLDFLQEKNTICGFLQVVWRWPQSAQPILLANQMFFLRPLPFLSTFGPPLTLRQILQTADDCMNPQNYLSFCPGAFHLPHLAIVVAISEHPVDDWGSSEGSAGVLESFEDAVEDLELLSFLFFLFMASIFVHCRQAAPSTGPCDTGWIRRKTSSG